MKFSTRTRYGLRAILEIALNGSGGGIYQKDIAANQNLSYKYLDHIINSLKVAGLVTKAGGRRSGYIITRKPSEITIYDIHSAFEPGVCVVDCVSENYLCKRKDICALFGFWGNLNRQFVEILKSTTLEDIMNEQSKLGEITNTTLCE
ncbi:MAG TPA: Rrf2 family transcriptional regulator [Draconibacterium sp.]|nr:Rrf2 family transcriptional regulator [Draconibacterium sp.]